MKYEYRYRNLKSIRYTLNEHDLKAAVIRHIETVVPQSLPSDMPGTWKIEFCDDDNGRTFAEVTYEFEEL